MVGYIQYTVHCNEWISIFIPSLLYSAREVGIRSIKYKSKYSVNEALTNVCVCLISLLGAGCYLSGVFS